MYQNYTEITNCPAL